MVCERHRLWQLPSQRRCLKESSVKDKRTPRTPSEFDINRQVPPPLQTCSLLEHFWHVGATSVACGSLVICHFQKVLSTENSHFKIESLWHEPKAPKSFSTRCKEGSFSLGSCSFFLCSNFCTWLFAVTPFKGLPPIGCCWHMSVYSPVMGCLTVTT